MLKPEYPKAITDLLGIPAQQGKAGPWMSTEGTVLSTWLQAVAEALSVPYDNKVDTMRRLVEAVGQRWDPVRMASTSTSSGGGGNISTPAFVALYEGLRADPAGTRRREINAVAPPFTSERGPDAADDRRAWRAIRDRRGQPRFRHALLRAYGHRCAVTDWDVVEVLEAAHITPYGQGGTYAVSNGLLLRADLHTLFDARLLAFDDQDRVLLHPRLSGTAVAVSLSSSRLRPPAGGAPDRAALAAHRRACGF